MAQNIITGELALRASYDPVNEALKTVPASTSAFAIVVDQANDSITEYPAKGIATITVTDTIIDVKDYKEVAVYVQGTANLTLTVSPLDSGSFFVSVTSSVITDNSLPISGICARRLKISYTGTPTGIYFVGRN